MSSHFIHVPSVIETRSLDKYILSWMEGQIFQVEVRESVFLEVADIEEIQTHKIEMTKGMKYVVFFVCPPFGSLSKEAREFLAQPESNKNAIAKAVFTPNLGTRMLTDFFIMVNKPPVPHKAFRTKEEAYKWMQEQINTSQSSYSIQS